jgi:hypothetical protein
VPFPYAVDDHQTTNAAFSPTTARRCRAARDLSAEMPADRCSQTRKPRGDGGAFASPQTDVMEQIANFDRGAFDRREPEGKQ